LPHDIAGANIVERADMKGSTVATGGDADGTNSSSS
jgi:hypothetical protein